MPELLLLPAQVDGDALAKGLMQLQLWSKWVARAGLACTVAVLRCAGCRLGRAGRPRALLACSSSSAFEPPTAK